MAQLITKPTLESEKLYKSFEFIHGEDSVRHVLESIEWPKVMYDNTVVLADGKEIPKNHWDMAIDARTQSLVVAIVPTGGDGDGKQILNTIAIIAITVATAGYGASLAAASPLISAQVGATIGSIYGIVGVLAYSALFPPPDQSLGDESNASQSQSFFLNGQSNQLTPYGIVPRVYGEHRMYPRIVGQPFIEPVGTSNFLTMLFDFGYGELSISDVRIGTTHIDTFLEATTIPHPNYAAGDDLLLYNRAVFTTSIGQTLLSGVLKEVPTTNPSADVYLDFNALRGFYHYDTDVLQPQGVNLKIEASTDGATWQPLGDVIDDFQSYGSMQFNAFGGVYRTDFDIRAPLISGNEGGDIPAENLRNLTVSNPRDGVVNQIQLSQISGAVDPSIAPDVGEYIYLGGQWREMTNVNSFVSGIAPPYTFYDITFTPSLIGAKPAANSMVSVADEKPIVTEEKYIFGWAAPWNQFETTESTLSIGDEVQMTIFGNQKRTITNVTGPTGGVYTITIDGTFDAWSDEFDNSGVGYIPLPAYALGDYNSIDTFTVGGATLVGAAMTVNLIMKSSAVWQFRITRVDPDHTDATTDQSELTWASIRVMGEGQPVNPDVNHALLEVRLLATDQLQGTIQELSANVGAKIPTYYNGVRSDLVTRNPAWIFVDILHGNANGRPVPLDRIDMERIEAWARECDEEVPSTGKLENYRIDTSVTVTTTTMTVIDLSPNQLPPKVGEYLIDGLNPRKISAVTTTADVDGYEKHAITFEAMTNPKPVGGEFEVVTIAENNTGLERRYTCDIIVDFKTTVRELLQIVASTGRATPTMRDGKYSVVRETDARQVIQMITPRNASNISASMNYLNPPDAIRLKYIDERTWDQEELFIYTGASDPANATIFEDITLTGTTRRSQAYRLGQYYLAEALNRRESISCSMDIENLVATRGDIIAVATDVLVDQIATCRVTNVAGTVITVDDHVQHHPLDFARIRKSDGTTAMYTVSLVGGTDDQFNVTGMTGVGVGDLVELGTKETLRKNYILESVTSGANLSANLNLVEHAPEILNAASGSIPTRVARSLPAPLISHVIEPTAATLKLRLSWQPQAPEQRGYSVYRVDNGSQRLITQTNATSHEIDLYDLMRGSLTKATYAVTYDDRFAESPLAKQDILLDRATAASLADGTHTINLTTAFTAAPTIYIDPVNDVKFQVSNVTTTSFDLLVTTGTSLTSSNVNWYAVL